MFNLIGDLVEGAANTVGDFVEDPIGKTVDMATQPIIDSLDVLEGLSEGELRVYAATRLGADYVTGMAASEIIGALMELDG